MCRFGGSTTSRRVLTASGCWSTGSGRGGLTKAKAGLAEWCKQVAPSTALRRWYGHDPAKFEEFASRYRAELDQPERATALLHLRDLAENGPLTLLTATKQPDISEAAVLADLLRH
jgi:uncharacterized protein YeaO (DUF488 family)